MTNIVNILCEAKNLKKCVELHYDGHNRTVEIHAVGRNAKTGNTLLRCFQVSGGSNSGQPIAWKLMTVSKISNCSITGTRHVFLRLGFLLHTSLNDPDTFQSQRGASKTVPRCVVNPGKKGTRPYTTRYMTRPKRCRP